MRIQGDRSLPNKTDLRESVTVFVATVGYPTFEKCLEYLHAQDSEFQLKIVDHVGPSAALQYMMDECTTPFYVEVDEDVLLYPQAIRTLHERICAMGAEVAQIRLRSVRCSPGASHFRSQDLSKRNCF